MIFGLRPERENGRENGESLNQMGKREKTLEEKEKSGGTIRLLCIGKEEKRNQVSSIMKRVIFKMKQR